MTKVEIIDGKPAIRIPHKIRSDYDDLQKLDVLEIGDTATYRRTVTYADIALFAAATGDTNPFHFDEVYASKSRFKQRIAHGMLVTGYISTVLGTILPGPGTIYLNQTLKFKNPVYVGDTITAVAKVTKIKEDKPLVTLQTDCINQKGEKVVEGEAVVIVDYVALEDISVVLPDEASSENKKH
ncbi:MAG: MaoC family dehydratase [Thermoplasmata archaeon]|nr:MAG: MaoC family dehydratase [Thermoplasmata archaeon]